LVCRCFVSLFGFLVCCIAKGFVFPSSFSVCEVDAPPVGGVGLCEVSIGGGYVGVVAYGACGMEADPWSGAVASPCGVHGVYGVVVPYYGV